MKKLSVLTVIAALVALTFFVGYSPNVSAQTPTGQNQSDQAILDAGDEDAIFCGVEQKSAEAYTLHVSASATEGDNLTLRITFRDGDSIAYPIPNGTSFSVTHALGGVPDVDDQVKITLEGDTTSTASDPAALASVKVNGGAKDPFAGDGEADNFCLTFVESVAAVGGPYTDNADFGDLDGDPGDDQADDNF